MFVITNTYAVPHTANSKLRTYEQALYREYDKILDTIQKNFAIPQQTWNQLKQDIKRHKQFARNNCYKNGIKGTHDRQLPVNIKKMIFNICHQYGINPYCITIIWKKNITSMYGLNCLARTYSARIKSNGSQLKQIAPAQLHINESNFMKLSYQEQFHCIAHEIQHLIDNHSLETTLIKKTLRACGHTDFENNSAFKKYDAIQEKCADLLPCLYDKKIAQAALYKSSKDWTFRRVAIHPYQSQETMKIALQNILACY